MPLTSRAIQIDRWIAVMKLMSANKDQTNAGPQIKTFDQINILLRRMELGNL
jgi:hypothetical protein